MTRRPLCSPLLLTFSLLGTGCAIPRTIHDLELASPPPQFGRPGWVRTVAGVGGWIGGIAGGAVSVVLLPITWPASLLVRDSLTEASADEFLFFPAIGLACVGHAALGGPADVVDWAFRRSWVDSPDPITRYDYTPLPAAVLPKPLPEHAGGQ